MAYSYLIETAEALFLVDGGMVGSGHRILRKIAEIGRKPEQLVFALVTHAHIDHIGGLAHVQAASDCAIICHPAHANTIRSGGSLVSPGLNISGKIYEHVAGVALPLLRLPRLGRVFDIEDGTSLRRHGLAGRVVYTPGHSAGDLTLVLDDGSAFVGDLVQGPRVSQVLPPEFSIMAVDEPAMLASWHILLKSGATTLYPGHGSIVSTDRIVPVYRRAVARKTRVAQRLATATAGASS